MEKIAKRVRIFQHAPFEGPGFLSELLSGFGVETGTTRWFDGDVPPSPESYDCLLVLGGPMGTYDEPGFPWLREEKRALKAALDSGRGVLGICLGAQLLAEVLGGKVEKNPQPEIGWLEVERIPGAEAHWAARCFPERFTTFHWHGDTYSLPPAASRLFRSQACDQQGFAWGEKCVALQFHPEVTRETLDAWTANGMADTPPGPTVQSPERILAGLDHCRSNHAWLSELCRNWLERSSP